MHDATGVASAHQSPIQARGRVDTAPHAAGDAGAGVFASEHSLMPSALAPASAPVGNAAATMFSNVDFTASTDDLRARRSRSRSRQSRRSSGGGSRQRPQTPVLPPTKSALQHGAIYEEAATIPKEYVCPLTKLVMNDPVITMEGIMYVRVAAAGVVVMVVG